MITFYKITEMLFYKEISCVDRLVNLIPTSPKCPGVPPRRRGRPQRAWGHRVRGGTRLLGPARRACPAPRLPVRLVALKGSAVEGNSQAGREPCVSCHPWSPGSAPVWVCG